MRFNCLPFFRLPKNFLLILFLSLYSLCFGQATVSKIDQKDLKKFIETLTSVPYEGRAVDNNGQIKTQEFIIDRFKTLQLEAFSPDGYLEKFLLNCTDRGEIYLKTPNRQKLLNFDRMVFLDEIRHDAEIEKEVVFGGNGTENELNRINVENRFVLILLNPNEEIAVKRRLEERRAAGLIAFHSDDNPFDTMKRRWKSFHTEKRYTIADHQETGDAVPSNRRPFDSFSITIPGEEVKNIIGQSKNKLVNLAKKRKIKSVPPSKISLHFEQVRKTVETANVIGVIRGESEQSIVISAHYDHVGKDENHYYPGADDNASGVAALLELAEEFAQYEKLHYTMIFLAASAEENGLLGSNYHVNHPDFEPDKVVCNINMDMISRCDGKQTDCNYLYCISDNQSDVLDSLVRETDELFPDCMCDYSENYSDIFSRTDGFNFSKKGIPSLLFFTGFHDDYHRPTDTMEKIDFDILENRIRLINEVIKSIQNQHAALKPAGATTPQ